MSLQPTLSLIMLFVTYVLSTDEWQRIQDRVEVDDVSDLAERIRQAWKEESGGLTDGTEAMGA